MRFSLVALLLTTTLAVSCGKEPLKLSEGCQPLLAGQDCLLPYPSDFFRVEDARQPTGFRIETRGAARLVGTRGENADVSASRPFDGYSRIPTLIALLAADVSPEGFPALLGRPEDSLDGSTSHSLIVEADTGLTIPHFVDLDPRATDPLRRAIVLHPIVGLGEQTRYVVALHGVTQTDGSLVSAPEGFRRLRDGEVGSDPALEPLRKRFEEHIFPELKKAGLERKSLQLAWEFTTGSDQSVTADMLRIRELTLAWLATHTPLVTVTEVVENPFSDVWREVRGTVSMPLFVGSTEPGARLTRDENGAVVQSGTASFPFEAQIPASVRDGFDPGRPLTYGHGFFGDADEIRGSTNRHLTDRLKMVVFAIDWWGMTVSDTGKVADALTGHPSALFDFTDRVHQAMANWLVFTRALQGPMRAQEAFHRPTVAGQPGTSTQGGQSNAGLGVYRAEPAGFLGSSEGALLGGVMTALNPDVARSTLHTGGAGFTHLMMRARPFDTYLQLLELSIKDPLELQKYLVTTQRGFDRIDPGTYAQWVLTNKLSGSPENRHLLLQAGLGDAQVPNLGTYLHARLLGLPVLEDTPYHPYGLESAFGPLAGSALALYNFGIDLEAVYAKAQIPREGNEVHDGLRTHEGVVRQLERFYQDGTIVNACTGVCDPD